MNEMRHFSFTPTYHIVLRVVDVLAGEPRVQRAPLQVGEDRLGDVAHLAVADHVGAGVL